MRNKKWSRDEIIILLNFYHEHYPHIPAKTSPKVKEMSDLIRNMKLKLDGELNEEYRNPNGVYMKMMNFHHFNPDYEGDGLKGGSILDRELVNKFWTKPIELKKLSNQIKAVINTNEQLTSFDEEDDIIEDVQEGRVMTRLHRYRERDSRIVKRKKDATIQSTNMLQCECCGFDFEKAYGQHGKGFIECHHVKPVSEIQIGEKTKLDDLSLVCSNCHRMIHRSRPWLTIHQVKKILSDKSE